MQTRSIIGRGDSMSMPFQRRGFLPVPIRETREIRGFCWFRSPFTAAL
jgi:hypothetical protein